MKNAPDKPGAGGLASPSDPGWQSLGDFHGSAVYVKDGADADTKDAAMNGHGDVYGACGHKTGGCRCSHGGAVRRFGKEPCVDCATAPTTSASADSAYILRLADAGDGKSIPLGLEGFPPTDDAGQTIHYRRVLVARCGKWFHCGTGDPLNISTDRADEWARNVAALSAAGRQPFIPVRHAFDGVSAAENLGKVIRLEREGSDLYAVIALHGDEALQVAARNSRSVGIIRDARDVNGKVYPGEWLHHLALVPNAAMPNLGGHMKIAASADSPARDVPVFDYIGNAPPPTKTPSTAAPRRKGSLMDPTLAVKARAAFSLSADAVPDERLDDAVAEKALALSADLATRTTERDAALRERDAAKADADAKGRDVLALSANDPSKLDQITLGIVSDGIFSRRDLAVRHGAVSEAEAKGLDAILSEADGTPNRIALSVTGTGKERRPAAVKIWDWVMSLGANGIRTGTARPGDVTQANPTLGLSADRPSNPDLQKQMIALANGSGGPIGGVAKMTRDE
jgi:hypothetical protein